MLYLFVDTDCDITKKIADEYGVGLISMPYRIGDQEVYPYQDWEEFDSHAFYDMLRQGTLPSTSGLSPQQYYNYFKPHFEKGEDILYVHFSAAMTGTFEAMNIALQQLKEEHPSVRFETIDTMGITILGYAITMEILKRYKAGATLDELLEFADKEVQHFACYFFADDLKFFARSGRVSKVSATMGNLIGIKPIITMGPDGKMGATGTKATGRRGALKMMMNYVEELGDNIKDYIFIVGHNDSPDLAAMLVKALHEKYGEDLQIETVICNPTAGSHSGPDGAGVCFHAKHR